jgi:carbon storage regulator
MLVLTRRVGEEIVIAGDIRVTVVAVNGQRVRLGITAPPSVAVVRLELLAEDSERARSPGNGRPGKCQVRGCASTESAF